MGGATLAGSKLLAAITGVGFQAGVATTAVSGLGIALRAVFAVSIVGLVASLVGSFISLASSMGEVSDKATVMADATKHFEQIGEIGGYIKQVKELSEVTDRTSDDIAAFNELHAQIKEMYPDIKTSIHNEIQDVGELSAAYQLLTRDLEEYANSKIAASQAEAIAALGAYDTTFSGGMGKVHGYGENGAFGSITFDSISRK